MVVVFRQGAHEARSHQPRLTLLDTLETISWYLSSQTYLIELTCESILTGYLQVSWPALAEGQEDMH